MYSHVERAISPMQHGFVKGRSTTTNLLIFSQTILSNMNAESQTDCILTDFMKAFDTVSHNILLHKLQWYGFSPHFINFIHSYLKNRENIVTLYNESSEIFISTSGVPQGTILGPLFFVLFINDLPSVLTSAQGLLFADDLKIFQKINSVNDCVSLQKDIDNIVLWCKNNNLMLNLDKCKFISFFKSKFKIQCDYKIDNSPLPEVLLIKDLGVLFNQKMNFKVHINQVVNRAHQNLSFILRNTSYFTNLNVFVILYFSLVRSILEYASIIWMPDAYSVINEIEKVQKRFVRFLYFKSFRVYPKYPVKISYIEQLSTLQIQKNINIPMLSLRREFSCLIFVHNIIYNKVNDNVLLYFMYFRVPNVRLRNNSQHYSIFSVNHNGLIIDKILLNCNNILEKVEYDFFSATLNQIRTRFYMVS